jgi:hypothetical protein
MFAVFDLNSGLALLDQFNCESAENGFKFLEVDQLAVEEDLISQLATFIADKIVSLPDKAPAAIKLGVCMGEDHAGTLGSPSLAKAKMLSVDPV